MAVFFTHAGTLAATLVSSLQMRVELCFVGLRDHKLAYNSSSKWNCLDTLCHSAESAHLSDISYPLEGKLKIASASAELWAELDLACVHCVFSGDHLKCDILLFLHVSAYGNNRSMGYLWIITFVLHACGCSPSLGGFVDEKRVTTVVWKEKKKNIKQWSVLENCSVLYINCKLWEDWLLIKLGHGLTDYVVQVWFSFLLCEAVQTQGSEKPCQLANI